MMQGLLSLFSYFKHQFDAAIVSQCADTPTFRFLLGLVITLVVTGCSSLPMMDNGDESEIPASLVSTVNLEGKDGPQENESDSGNTGTKDASARSDASSDSEVVKKNSAAKKPAEKTQVRKPLSPQKQSKQVSAKKKTVKKQAATSSVAKKTTSKKAKNDTPKTSKTSVKASKSKVVATTVNKVMDTQSQTLSSDQNAAKSPKEMDDAAAQMMDASASSLLQSLNQLPLGVDALWTVQREMGKSGQCVLVYQQQTLFDGHGDSKVDLKVFADKVIFKTRSNIDTSYDNTGVKVDDNPVILIESLFGEASVKYETRFPMLIEQFKQGTTAVLSLGFWPTWPMTEARHLDFDVSGFENAYETLQACTKLEKELK